MFRDQKVYNILIIEDNLGDFTIVEDLLEEKMAHAKIERAINFKTAFDILSGNSCSYDVILLDLSLPDKNGQPLIDAMLEAALECPIIILTGYSDIDFGIKSISQNISDYLLKDELTTTTLYKSIVYAIERQKVISQLKESEKSYSDLFHLSPQPMWVYDVESLQFLSVNDSAIKNYGFTEEEFLSMTIKDIRPAEDITLLEDSLENTKNNEHLFAKEIYRHKKKNEEIINVEVHSNIIYINDRKAELILANDITERLKYIQAIEEQNKRFQEIAWTQSHIVRAPLARMMSIVNLIKDLKATTQESEELLNHFVDSSNELEHDLAKMILNYK